MSTLSLVWSSFLLAFFVSFCLLRVRVRVRVCMYGKAFCFISGKGTGVRETASSFPPSYPFFPFLSALCFPLSYPP
ncbi:hypothetical protein J3E72DRAFT_277385 [Bipolaris maydis]|uniref:uncharacterized protein n=1 Tax=Cochliobolus heterostrophus TaxID=5016 RepID=UPI0024D5A4F5|nr:hypothetical protein J3E73DRAFT_302030 [Bipolaris maydis]KAJ5059078.1 hypothetical protein J3E74DRAFT_355026 [Bipolaris maydis]KAJ6202662.1 hypothetical protein J3E72DRAFT_277385 [Bipolaris maydis]KAJ6209065.1 hypothetical protein PSV09DRAFT_2314750 [Bipolaris maydis]KAJ6270946.1 hypothetical protein PSV08DRAFT_300050 [Bipolaris maydis]